MKRKAHECPQMWVVVADVTPDGGPKKRAVHIMLSMSREAAAGTFLSVCGSLKCEAEVVAVESGGSFLSCDEIARQGEAR